jgi:hypothetical protein
MALKFLSRAKDITNQPTAAPLIAVDPAAANRQLRAEVRRLTALVAKLSVVQPDAAPSAARIPGPAVNAIDEAAGATPGSSADTRLQRLGELCLRFIGGDAAVVVPITDDVVDEIGARLHELQPVASRVTDTHRVSGTVRVSAATAASDVLDDVHQLTEPARRSFSIGAADLDFTDDDTNDDSSNDDVVDGNQTTRSDAGSPVCDSSDDVVEIDAPQSDPLTDLYRAAPATATPLRSLPINVITSPAKGEVIVDDDSDDDEDAVSADDAAEVAAVAKQRVRGAVEGLRGGAFRALVKFMPRRLIPVFDDLRAGDRVHARSVWRGARGGGGGATLRDDGVVLAANGNFCRIEFASLGGDLIEWPCPGCVVVDLRVL